MKSHSVGMNRANESAFCVKSSYQRHLWRKRDCCPLMRM